MKTRTATNSEPYKNKVRSYCIKQTYESGLSSSSPFYVELYLQLSSNARSDPINVLSWSLRSLNASCTCVLVSRIIYDVKMTVFFKESNCLNGKNTCSSPAIWTLILTSCLRSEMKILPSCGVITYLLSVIS